MRTILPALLITSTCLTMLLSCASTGGGGTPVPVASRSASGADPARFSWKVGEHRVSAYVEFEKPLRPGDDYIGGYVEVLEIVIDGKKQDLTQELHRRSHGIFGPSVEMGLRARDDGFEIAVFPLSEGGADDKTAFVFDWEGKLLR